MDADLRAALQRALGAEVVRAERVRGGDVAIAYTVELADDRRVFAKTHPGAPSGFFTTEASGLRWLGEACERDGSIAVPDVLAVSDDRPNHLVLAWIDEGHPRAATDGALGEGLARMHRIGASCFGREDRRTTGSRGLPNEPSATWSEFYATNRLLPLARLARDSGALPDSSIDDLVRVAETLDRFGAAADEPPARLHGDLWGGNRLVDVEGRNWLVDPAAHGGHREFDLAMMRLFGGFRSECFAAYDDVAPLAAGWEERVPLHQLAPLVVHAIKFGGGYVAASIAAISRFT
ncbi:MAG: fructosamine kinase family protein [Acidimicrobiia bacterium]